MRAAVGGAFHSCCLFSSMSLACQALPSLRVPIALPLYQGHCINRERG